MFCQDGRLNACHDDMAFEINQSHARGVRQRRLPPETLPLNCMTWLGAITNVCRGLLI